VVETQMRKRVRLLRKRTRNLGDEFITIISTPSTELVKWVENDRMKNGDDRLLIKTTPVDVGKYLRQSLFQQDVTAILVSATMSIAGTFEYIAGRLGIDDYDGIDVGTPFDFASQALLYVPKHLPEPTPSNRQAWASMMTAEIASLVKASRGRALLLFTSFAQMRDTYSAIADRIDYPTMMQGQLPNAVLAERFRDEEDSVLFATRSFFTGANFLGSTCSLVVIDKLPFPIPTDPVVEARCEALQAVGKHPFMHYSVPVMTLPLKQGLGRLIRHRSERGVMAILDPRLITKGYGSQILKSLPSATLTHDLDDVQRFFDVPAEAVSV